MPIEDSDTDTDVGNSIIHGHASAYTGTPGGATLNIGISSKRKRFKAYTGHIGEVEGETGLWVCMEIPLPVDSGGNRGGQSATSMSMNSSGGNFDSNNYWPIDDRQWNDGCRGEKLYPEINRGRKAGSAGRPCKQEAEGGRGKCGY